MDTSLVNVHNQLKFQLKTSVVPVISRISTYKPTPDPLLCTNKFWALLSISFTTEFEKYQNKKFLERRFYNTSDISSYRQQRRHLATATYWQAIIAFPYKLFICLLQEYLFTCG